MEDLKENGVHDVENILNIRSFLDHDREFVPPHDQASIERRAAFPYSGVYVDSQGAAIPAAAAVQALVEHLRRWRAAAGNFGITLLEVHCLRPEAVRRLGARVESLYFDAYHGFSGQQLFEAPVFLMAAAEAGLVPDRRASRRFPRSAPFTRITLNRFCAKPYSVRHAVSEDLDELIQLEAASLPGALRTSREELDRRVRHVSRGAGGTRVEGRIAAVLYSQRIDGAAQLRASSHAGLRRLHNPAGSCANLLGICVRPEFQDQNLAGELLDFMLVYFAACDGIEVVAGVTRCHEYSRHRETAFADYIRQRRTRPAGRSDAAVS